MLFPFSVIFLLTYSCKGNSFYERNHNEFVTINANQISRLPHIDETIKDFPIIPVNKLKDASKSFYFDKIHTEIAKVISKATISIISIYKRTSNTIIDSIYPLYPYQVGTCTLVQDPYPNDPRVVALEKNVMFNKEYWNAHGYERTENDIFIKSLNCITNYHIVRPYVRFYATKPNEYDQCIYPYNKDIECYKLIKVYPDVFLKIYYSLNNTRKEELFINNDYIRAHKYFYIVPSSGILYPKLPDKTAKYYQNMDKHDSETFDVAIINFEKYRQNFERFTKYILNTSVEVCEIDYKGWTPFMKIYVIGFPTKIMTEENAKMLQSKGVWNKIGTKYINYGEFGKLEDSSMATYNLNVNEGNSGGMIYTFVQYPESHKICLNIIHSTRRTGIKVNMTYLSSIGLSRGFRIPIKQEIIYELLEKNSNKMRKNDL